VYDAVFVFSPSVDIDSAWDPVRDFAKGLKESSFHSEWDEPALLEILAKQKALVKEKKTAMSTKPLPQALVIIDDFADREAGTLGVPAGYRRRNSRPSARWQESTFAS
jgi:hypothetical protein